MAAAQRNDLSLLKMFAEDLESNDGDLLEENAQQFDGLYKRLADKYGVPLYPFFLDGVAQDPAHNQADGMHPNPKGVDVVVDHLLPFVTKNLDTYASAHAAPVRSPARP